MPTADELLGPDVVTALATCVERATGNAAPHLRRAAGELGARTFTERTRWIRDAALADLPREYGPFAAAVRTALRDDAFTGWMILPVTEAVAVLGRAEFEPALALLAELTPRLTAEGAVRPFLTDDLRRALAVMAPWAAHADEHVRRLASEGTRPRLPWAPVLRSLIDDPTPALPILDALYRDESEYVRRSVANHLNDISRDHADVAVAAARRWLDTPDANTVRVVRHGLRTLVKAGNPAALALLGFSHDLALHTTVQVSTPTVHLGEALVFDFEVTHNEPGPTQVAVDYVIHHVKANGNRTPKVFKLATRTLAPGEAWSGSRRHAIKPISTRRYYPGAHRVDLQVNGVLRGGADFTLVME